MKLVEQYGTPLKFTYLPQISNNINKAKGWFRKAMEKHKYEGKYHYCYCTKSSHFQFIMNEAFKNNIHIETSSAVDINIVESLLEEGKINKNTFVICNGFKRDAYVDNIARIINNGQKNTIPVIDNYEASSGDAIFTTTFEDDDNDGVPNALEFDGDTDGDGIPNYKDYDDDGDNVPTINESPDPNGDGDLSDMKDTDSDSIPDYLDMDDDNDGTDTKFEDENNNGNLFDDLAIGANVARFLDGTVNTTYEIDVVKVNQFSRNYKVNVTLEDIDISILSTDSFFLGTYKYTVDYPILD